MRKVFFLAMAVAACSKGEAPADTTTVPPPPPAPAALTAAAADMKVGRLRLECVTRMQCGIAHRDDQLSVGAGRPECAVSGAERAGAGACGDFDGLRKPAELEADVSTMAFSVNQHCVFLGLLEGVEVAAKPPPMPSP